MATCGECEFFNPLSEDADDYERGKGDCVTEKADEKGKYWLSKPVFETSTTCDKFHKYRSAGSYGQEELLCDGSGTCDKCRSAGNYNQGERT